MHISILYIYMYIFPFWGPPIGPIAFGENLRTALIEMPERQTLVPSLTTPRAVHHLEILQKIRIVGSSC